MNNRSRLSRFNSIEQDVNKTITGSLSHNYMNHSSHQDPRKIMQILQKIAKQQRQKRQQIEHKYQQFKQRNISRQKQFYKILAKFDAHFGNQSTQEIHIEQLYQKILQTFNAFNEKARQLLEDRYSQLYRLMERRIDILMQKMDKQLSKYRKLSEAQLKQMRNQIKQMASIAASIENQNLQIRKKNQNLQLKNKLLNEQKRLLLEQIIFTKCYINKQRKRSAETTTQKDKYQQLESISNNITVKPKKQNLNDFFNNLQSIQFQNPYKINAQRKSATSRSYRYKKLQNKQQETNQKGKILSSHNGKVNKSSNYKTVQHPASNMTVGKQNESLKSTLIHLKSCLQRQRNKNHQLIKFSLELQTKQQKIKELIKREIQKQITKPTQRSTLEINSQNQIYYNQEEVVNQQKKNVEGEKQKQSRFQQIQKFQNKQYARQNLVVSNISMNQSGQQYPSMTRSHKNNNHKQNQSTLKQQQFLSNILSQINKILHLPQSNLNSLRTSIQSPQSGIKKQKLTNEYISQKLNNKPKYQNQNRRQFNDRYAMTNNNYNNSNNIYTNSNSKIKQNKNYTKLRYNNANLSINLSNISDSNTENFISSINKNSFVKNNIFQPERHQVNMDIAQSISI